MGADDLVLQTAGPDAFGEEEQEMAGGAPEFGQEYPLLRHELGTHVGIDREEEEECVVEAKANGNLGVASRGCRRLVARAHDESARSPEAVLLEDADCVARFCEALTFIHVVEGPVHKRLNADQQAGEPDPTHLVEQIRVVRELVADISGSVHLDVLARQFFAELADKLEIAAKVVVHEVDIFCVAQLVLEVSDHFLNRPDIVLVAEKLRRNTEVTVEWAAAGRLDDDRCPTGPLAAPDEVGIALNELNVGDAVKAFGLRVGRVPAHRAVLVPGHARDRTDRLICGNRLKQLHRHRLGITQDSVVAMLHCVVKHIVHMGAAEDDFLAHSAHRVGQSVGALSIGRQKRESDNVRLPCRALDLAVPNQLLHVGGDVEASLRQGVRHGDNSVARCRHDVPGIRELGLQLNDCYFHVLSLNDANPFANFLELFYCRG